MASEEAVQKGEELLASIKPGDRIQVSNHDYANASGEREVSRIEGRTIWFRKPHKRSRHRHQESYLTWPTPEEDFEVEGRVLKIYNPRHPYVGGRRALTLEMDFAEQ